MKKILGLTIAALLVMALVGGGTWAYFSDPETSSGNVFTAGTLDLKVSNDASTYSDNVTATWGDAVNPVYPGYTSSGTVTMKNTGTLTADHVEITFDTAATNYASAAAVATDTGDADIADMSSEMRVTALSYGGTSILAAQITLLDSDSSTYLELDELDGQTIDDLTAPAANEGDTQAFAMTVEIPTAVGNGIQGDQVTLTVTFTINQHSSQ